MSDPQVWTLIGVFAASTFALVGLVSTTFLRVLQAEIRALDAKLTAKLDVLDKDISAIARRVFPDER
ncbi:hypothetical protein GCM10027062_31770 [Nocardioides hungaricus]